MIAHAATINISSVLPGTSGSPTDLGGAVNGFYLFALMIGGVLAFGAVVYGGVKYTLSAGNPSGQGEAKEYIQGALVGLLLLAGAYLILKTINPDLVNLGLPGLDKINLGTSQ